MLAIVLASHGSFASGIKQSATMIFGEQEQVATVEFMPGDDPDKLKERYDTVLEQFDPDADVLFLLDLWGGSPFNVASRIVAEHTERMALITGLNLAMLIETYTVRTQPLTDVVAHIEATAKSGVKHLEL